MNEKEIIECVMCGAPTASFAEAKYKSGIVKEPLCKICTDINQQIIEDKK